MVSDIATSVVKQGGSHMGKRAIRSVDHDSKVDNNVVDKFMHENPFQPSLIVTVKIRETLV